MSKYIDADCLKAKLDEHYRKYQSKYMETRNPYTQGLIDALDLAEQVIDSLQQEQPSLPDSLDEAANKFAVLYDQGTCDGIAQECFKAGAEWAMQQLKGE